MLLNKDDAKSTQILLLTLKAKSFYGFSKSAFKTLFFKSRKLDLSAVSRLDNFNVFVSKQYPFFINKQRFFSIESTAICWNSSMLKLWFYELLIFGLGYRVVIKNNLKTLRLNLGFSHSICLFIPPTLTILKRKKRFLILSSNKVDLLNFLIKLLLIKKFNSYKLKGLHLKGFLFKAKPGKRSR